MIIRMGEREQLRALTHAFMARFFENEITTGTDDLKTSFFWPLSVLAVPGFLVPAGMALSWQLVATVEGPDALRVLARGDKAFYEGFAMVACAIVSAIAWNSLMTDRRDGIILGAMPVRPPIVVAARLAALGLYVALVAAAMNVLSSLSFGILLAANNTTAFALRGMFAHFTASCAAGVCVLLAVAGGQGLVLAALGPRRFSRVSPLLQLCLVAAIVVGFLTLPVINVSVVDTLKQAGPDARPWILATPPLWFLGVYEWVLGTDDPVLLGLARTAGVALAAGFVATVASYPVAYRRVMVAVIENADAGAGAGDRPARRLGRLLTALTGRAPTVRAVSQFLLATLGRAERHRFVIAAAIGTAVAWGLPSWTSVVPTRPRAPRADVLSLPLSSMLFLVVGLRIAASLPSDDKAGWMFEVSPPSNRAVRSAMERTMFAFGVLPVALLFVPLCWALWGPDVALTHLLVSVAMGVLLIEVALLRFAGMPCARPWNPDGVNLGRWWAAYVVGFLLFTGGVPDLELMLFGHPVASASFVGIVLMAAVGLRLFSLRKRRIARRDSSGFAPGDILSLN
jgi:hypothetical protein